MPNKMEFTVYAAWDKRAETSDDLADRLSRLLARLSSLDRRFGTWFARYLDKPERRLDAQNLPAVVAEGLGRDDDGEPDPMCGYHVDLVNQIETDWGPDSVILYMTGAALGLNQIFLTTPYDMEPDPDLVSYAMLREIMLAISETFQSDYTFVKQSDLTIMKDYQSEKGYIFPVIPLCWMIDLPPALASKVVLPADLVVDHRSNGHLVLAATDEDFDIDNPVHVAAAWTLYTVIDPLNRIPHGGG